MNSLAFDKTTFETKFFEAKAAVENTLGLTSDASEGFCSMPEPFGNYENRVVKVMRKNVWEEKGYLWKFLVRGGDHGYLQLWDDKKTVSDGRNWDEKTLQELYYDEDGRPKLENFFDITVRHHCLIVAYDIVSCYYDALNDDWRSAYSKAHALAEDAIPEQSYIARIINLEKHFKGYGFGEVFAMEHNDPECTTGKTSHKVLNSQQELFYELIKQDGRYRINAFSLYTNGNKYITTSKDNIEKNKETEGIEKRLRNNVQNMIKIFREYKDHSPDINTADGLLYLYRLESIFGVELADELYGKLSTQKKEGSVCLEGKDDMEILSYFGLLPNVFSRGIYAKYAMDSLEDVLYKRDRAYWYLPEFGRKSQWSEQVREKCLFYSEIMFPMLQWTFIISLFSEYDVLPDNEYLDNFKRGLKSSSVGEIKIKDVEKLFSGYDKFRKNNLRLLKEDLKKEIEMIADKIQNPLLEFPEIKELDETVKRNGFMKKENDLAYEELYLLGDIQNFLSGSQKLHQAKHTNFSCPELSWDSITKHYKDKWFDPLKIINDLDE